MRPEETRVYGTVERHADRKTMFAVAVEEVMSNVIKLAEKEPCRDIVHRCEWLLEQARSGRMRELVFVADMGDCCEIYTSPEIISFTQTIGRIRRLERQLHKELDELASVVE